jgi:toxin ParE1/3/4
MGTAVWTPAAEQDLENIFLYIGREKLSPTAAARVVREISEKADFYSTQPVLAEARPELGADLRAFYVHRYVIVYRPSTDGIEVLRVIHGSRDVFRVFEQREP